MATKWQIENKARWKAYMKEYGQRPDVRARRHELERLKRQNDPEWRARKNGRTAKWRAANLEKARAGHREVYRRQAHVICERQKAIAYRLKASQQSRARRAADPEKYRAKAKLYRERYPDMIRLYKSLEYSRKRCALGHASVQQVRGRFAFFGNVCRYCHQDKALTIDHAIPLVRGGTNWPANLAPACRSCNSRKHDKTHVEFMRVLALERAS